MPIEDNVLSSSLDGLAVAIITTIRLSDFNMTKPTRLVQADDGPDYELLTDSKINAITIMRLGRTVICLLNWPGVDRNELTELPGAATSWLIRRVGGTW